MRKQKIPIYSLRALLDSLRNSWRDWTAQRGATDTEASPFLVYIAAVLFLVLSILVIDLNRDELRALGLVGGAERINPVFMSP